MAHDLGIINAAVVLGDLVVPPLGTIVRWPGIDGYSWKVVGVGEERWSYSVKILRLPLGSYGLASATYDIPGSFQPEILSVPDDAPPFDEWLRK